jgi:lipopolysaccharide transport system ATP-binding protein
MSSDPVIKVSRVSKSYRLYRHPSERLSELLFRAPPNCDEFWALKDVDLTVHAGEAIGVVGRNGSGKSTLLQIVCGLSPPTDGTVSVRGRIAGLLELGAGFNPDFTGRENVEVAAAIMGLSRIEIAARFEAIAAFAGIGSYIDRPVYEYSSGMFARLAFAVCTQIDADILVIDEILAVGDAAFQQKCTRFLRNFQAGGGTLLFVSHSEAAVLTLCERAVFLDQGKVQADGPAGDVCRLYATSLQSGSDTFQSGGRTRPIVPPTASAGLFKQQARAGEFDFDPDAARESGEAAVERIALYSPHSARVTSAAAGERLELRIECRARSDIDDVLIAFIVRNRLGRQIFSDNTGVIERNGSRRIAAGEAFTATFAFHLPFLRPDDHAIEAFVFAGPATARRLIARSIDPHLFIVLSRHIGGGLANLPAMETAIEVNGWAREEADVQ